MAKVYVNINIVDVFNEVIEFINKIYEDREPPRSLAVLDTKFEIIINHLDVIGKRAIATEDEELIKRLIAIGVLTETEDESPVATEVPSPVS